VKLFLPQDAAAVAEPAPAEVLQRLHALLAAHLTPDGVLFDSHAWIITATLP
jgi:hypothetical protein